MIKQPRIKQYYTHQVDTVSTQPIFSVRTKGQIHTLTLGLEKSRYCFYYQPLPEL